MADAAGDADRGGCRLDLIACVNQFLGKLRLANQRHGPLDLGDTEAASPLTHGPGNRKEALAIRQFQPLRHDPAGRLAGGVDIP